MFTLYMGHISLSSWFSYGSPILIVLEFEDVGFCGGRLSGEPQKNPQGKARTNN